MGQDFYEMQHTELNSAAQAAQKSTRLRRNRFIFTSLQIRQLLRGLPKLMHFSIL